MLPCTLSGGAAKCSWIEYEANACQWKWNKNWKWITEDKNWNDALIVYSSGRTRQALYCPVSGLTLGDAPQPPIAPTIYTHSHSGYHLTHCLHTRARTRMYTRTFTREQPFVCVVELPPAGWSHLNCTDSNRWGGHGVGEGWRGGGGGDSAVPMALHHLPRPPPPHPPPPSALMSDPTLTNSRIFWQNKIAKIAVYHAAETGKIIMQ